MSLHIPRERLLNALVRNSLKDLSKVPGFEQSSNLYIKNYGQAFLGRVINKTVLLNRLGDDLNAARVIRKNSILRHRLYLKQNNTLLNYFWRFGSALDDLIRTGNGFIYGIPGSATSVLKINPSNDTTTTFGNLSGSAKWTAGILTTANITINHQSPILGLTSPYFNKL